MRFVHARLRAAQANCLSKQSIDRTAIRLLGNPVDRAVGLFCSALSSHGRTSELGLAVDADFWINSTTAWPRRDELTCLSFMGWP